MKFSCLLRPGLYAQRAAVVYVIQVSHFINFSLKSRSHPHAGALTERPNLLSTTALAAAHPCPQQQQAFWIWNFIACCHIICWHFFLCIIQTSSKWISTLNLHEWKRLFWLGNNYKDHIFLKFEKQITISLPWLLFKAIFFFYCQF